MCKSVECALAITHGQRAAGNTSLHLGATLQESTTIAAMDTKIDWVCREQQAPAGHPQFYETVGG